MISVISDQQLMNLVVVIGLLHWSVIVVDDLGHQWSAIDELGGGDWFVALICDGIIDDLTNAIKLFYKVPNIGYIGPELGGTLDPRDIVY